MLRGLLSLLILLIPLLSQAAIPHAELASTASKPAAEMPCHMTAEIASTDAEGVDDCPHCQHASPLAPCSCCSVAVPAAIAGAEVSTYLHSVVLVIRQRAATDSLAHAHRDRLFRPPIFPA